jgi:hypothetical protein
MDRMQRTRRGPLCALGVGIALLAWQPAAAEPPRGRCQQDALENWYCPSDAKGVAVRDNLGVVVCSPGRCVEVEDEWQCSPVSGGGAELTPEGPVCEGGCRAPRAVDCERGTGPT